MVAALSPELRKLPFDTCLCTTSFHHEVQCVCVLCDSRIGTHLTCVPANGTAPTSHAITDLLRPSLDNSNEGISRVLRFPSPHPEYVCTGEPRTTHYPRLPPTFFDLLSTNSREGISTVLRFPSLHVFYVCAGEPRTTHCSHLPPTFLDLPRSLLHT